MENEISHKKEEIKTTAESDNRTSRYSQSSQAFLLATHFHLELVIIHHRASLKLVQLNAGQTCCHTGKSAHWCFLRVHTQFSIDSYG